MKWSAAVLQPFFVTAFLSPGKPLSCICMPASAEQESLSQLWCSCRNGATCSPPLLVTHEYGSNWIHWKQTSVNWEDNDDHSQPFRGPAFKRGDCSYPPLACSSQQEEVYGRLRSRRGRGSAGLCVSFFFFFFQRGSNKTIKSLGSAVLFTPTPLRSIVVKEGAMWHIITANNK